MAPYPMEVQLDGWQDVGGDFFSPASHQATRQQQSVEQHREQARGRRLKDDWQDNNIGWLMVK